MNLTFLKTKSAKRLIALYFAVFLGILVLCFANWGRDALLIKSGGLSYFGMLPRGFFLGSIEPAPFEDYEISYVTTDTDTQMIYKGDPIYLNNVTIHIGYSKDPLEVNLYYLEEGDERFEDNQREDAFTEVKCILAQSGSPDERTYYFQLPVTKKVTTFRIDPASDSLVFMGMDTTDINLPRSFGSYFTLTGTKVLICLALPLLLYTLWAHIEATWTALRGKKQG
ncbi:MAG: hypothetical protein PHG02_10105 [Oscillospiraceae bacterium]|nr:hypothetical protein [Oscillospiraceae bacterium]